MKKIIALILCLILLVTFASPALADGDPNIDGGGGGTEDGTTTNKWNIGDDGVRVTIVRESDEYPMTAPVDYGNRDSTDINIYFGLHSKLYYKNNRLEAVTSAHPRTKPATPIPTVVSAGGAVNIDAVKAYFGTEGTIRDICDKTGFNFAQLVGGDYVIMLEPLVYITYNGIRFCMTATEAALYDRVTDGDLKSKLGNITHQNLPLAMFLEKPDLGFPALFRISALMDCPMRKWKRSPIG